MVKGVTNDWIVTLDNKPAGFTSTGNTVSCTAKGATAAVESTFDFTWVGCAVATRKTAFTAN